MLFSKPVKAEDTDAPEGRLEELGEEWPDFENPTLALQREFHQVQFSPSVHCGTHKLMCPFSCCWDRIDTDGIIHLGPFLSL